MKLLPSLIIVAMLCLVIGIPAHAKLRGRNHEIHTGTTGSFDVDGCG